MTLPLLPENIPHELKLITRWIPANSEKRPIIQGSWAAPESWSSFEEIKSLCEEGKAAWPCMVAGGGYTMVDFDNVITRHDKGLDWHSNEAKEVIKALASYTEISPSGKGIRVILRGEIDEDGNKIALPDSDDSYIEWWGGSNNRYCTVTGNMFKGCSEITLLTPEKEKLLLKYLTTKQKVDKEKIEKGKILPLLIEDETVLRDLMTPLQGKHCAPFYFKGDASFYDDDRSRAVFGCASSLYLMNYTDSQVLSCLAASPHVMAPAMERRGSRSSALEWIWDQCCQKARVNSASQFVQEMSLPSSPIDPDKSKEQVLAEFLPHINDVQSPGVQPIIDYIRELPDTSLARSVWQDKLNIALGGNSLPDIKKWTKPVATSKNQKAEGVPDLPDKAKGWVYVSGENRLCSPHSFITLDLKAAGVQLNIPQLTTEKMRQYVNSGTIPWAEGKAYIPGQQGVAIRHGIHLLSTWTPSAVTPYAGELDVSPWLGLFDMMGIVEEETLNENTHRWEVVKIRDHILDWLAFTLQYPEQKIYHAVLLYGMQGCGKDSLLRPITRIMGDNYSSVEKEGIEGTFNNYLEKAKVLQINELCPGQNAKDNVKFANKIKTLIAPSAHNKIQINPKYGRQYEIDNYVNVLAHTNWRDGIFLEEGDRRWFCVECLPGKAEVASAAYQDKLDDYYHWLDHEQGAEKVFRFLLDRDISHFKAQSRPPVTMYMRELIGGSKTGMKKRAHDILNRHLALRNITNIQEVYDYVRQPENVTLFQGGGMSFSRAVIAETLLELGFSARRSAKEKYYVRHTALDTKLKDLPKMLKKEQRGETSLI